MVEKVRRILHKIRKHSLFLGGKRSRMRLMKSWWLLADFSDFSCKPFLHQSHEKMSYRNSLFPSRPIPSSPQGTSRGSRAVPSGWRPSDQPEGGRPMWPTPRRGNRCRCPEEITDYGNAPDRQLTATSLYLLMEDLLTMNIRARPAIVINISKLP